ncbi:MAG: hypothetical protein KJ587_03375 [Alphaproteobacteria bacterium]|nr:hypothetical protein [Alphaproteobacteria bacterium]
MLRKQSFERLNRYRYEIAVAICLTIAALGLLAAASASRSVPLQEKADGSRVHFPVRAK